MNAALAVIDPSGYRCVTRESDAASPTHMLATLDRTTQAFPARILSAWATGGKCHRTEPYGQ